MSFYGMPNPKRLQALCAALEGQLDGQREPALLAEALCALLPGLDPAQTAADCAKLTQGILHGRQTLHHAPFQGCETVERLLPQLTSKLSAAERKGFYLTLYEAYRQSDRELCPHAETALPDYRLVPQNDEDALCRIAAQQLDLHAQDLLLTAADDADGPPPDPELLAAALYAAHKQGELLSPLAQDPALLGFACGAADEARGMAQEEQGRMVHLLLAALTALAMLSMLDPAASGLAQLLLQLVENGSYHAAVKTLLTPVIKMLCNLAPEVIAAFTFQDIREGLDVIYENVGQQDAPIQPWSTKLQLDEPAPIWPDNRP